MRPIDADGLKKAIKLEWDKVSGDTKHEQSLRGGIRKAVRCIEEAITLDYAPVRRGEWVHDINNLYGCSECLERETMSHKKLKKFCPNCGANMMDGGKSNG